MSQKLLIICDIDGTVADISRRLEKAGPKPTKESKAMMQRWLDLLQSDEELSKDAPIIPVLQLLNNTRSTLVYLTGRSERFRKATTDWLAKIGAPTAHLLMRDNQDWRKPHEYKKARIEKLMQVYPPTRYNYLTLDDDPEGDCTEVYRKLGMVHLKVFV